jgi:hypothetical protein
MVRSGVVGVLVRSIAVVTAALSLAAVGTPPASGAAAAAPAFECWWTEPFSSLVGSSAGVVWQQSMGEGNPERLRSASVRVVSGSIKVQGTRADGSRFAATVRHSKGSDGMSDYVTDWSGTIDGRPDGGACVRHRDGSTPRVVVHVATDDVLNIRSGPRVGAAVIATAYPGGFVFRRPGAARGAWVPVSVRRFPAGGTGRVTLRYGWANSRYLAAYP